MYNMRLVAVKHFVVPVRIFSALLFILSVPVYCKSEVVIKDIATAFNKLGDDVYKKLAKTQGNIVFSPFSVYCSLSLLTLGADGDTQLQLLSKLSLRNHYSLKENYRVISKYIHHISNQELHLANNLFITKQYDLLEQYKKELISIFTSKPQQVDYTKTTETASIINAWVANETNQTIRNIVDSHLFDKQTSLVLLSAIFSRIRWKVKFDKTETMPNYIFHTPKGTTRCNMMLIKRTVQEFHSESNVLMLSSYLHETEYIKLAFIRTIGNSTITEIEQQLDNKMFFFLVSQLSPASLIIKIPRFKVEGKHSLNKILSSIGLSQIFQKSNFSNMFTKPVQTSVGQMIQKAVIKINEAGATKSSAKEKGMGTGFARIFRKFVLDRPFLFFLYDRKNEIILLRGRIEEPNN